MPRYKLIFIFVYLQILFCPTSGSCFDQKSQYEKQILVTDLAVDTNGIPFLLDDTGEVWGFSKPFSLTDLVKIRGLRTASKLSPYIALTSAGDVFAWGLDSKSSRWKSPDDLAAVYTKSVHLFNGHQASSIDYKNGRFLAGFHDGNIAEWSFSDQREGKLFENPTIYHVPSNVLSVATSGHVNLAKIEGETFFGWGLNKSNQFLETSPFQNRISTPNVLSLQDGVKIMSTTDSHLVVLNNLGIVTYQGGCDAGAEDSTFGERITETKIKNVSDIAVSVDDNIFPDGFVVGNGEIWLGYAPSPRVSPGCGRSFANGMRVQKILGMNVPAVHVAVVSDGGKEFQIFSIGSDKSFWAARSENGHFLFSKVNLKVTNEQHERN